jgi:hypothetical protein
MSQTTTGMTLLPVDSIAMDTRPLRQIRLVSEEGVRKLVEETDPKNWDTIIVRPYPAGHTPSAKRADAINSSLATTASLPRDDSACRRCAPQWTRMSPTTRREKSLG